MLKDKGGIITTAPHVEINYGLLSNMDLHTVIPLVCASPHEGPTNYGFGDIELGITYRFLQESRWFPMMATFPLIELPTGDHKRGLGTGKLRAFIPIWLQKSWEGWTAYGGGGYWINPGYDNKNYWFTGWVVQHDLSKKLTLGVELSYTTPIAEGEKSHTGFNVGAIFNFTENHHFLFAAGRDIHGSNRFTMYIGYQLTFGPKEEKKQTTLSSAWANKILQHQIK